MRAALATLPPPASDDEWIWLLHDDANPDPDALLALTLAIEEYPDADILGPKLREWPSLRRLLEVGLTITGTGHRETGLERGEYDQGQHDEPRRVLAVNTAGMLVRRRVLEELGGFDDELPIFGNDIDFGWRAAQAGHRTMVIPQAVLFHAEAAHRGVRRTPLTGRHTHFQERRAALFTMLANAPATGAAVAGGAAVPRLAAAGAGLPRRPLGGRGARRARGRALASTRGPATCDPPGGRGPVVDGEAPDARSLLAPLWLPYRHGLDFVTDLAAAATNQASDVAERRRAAKLAAEAPALHDRSATGPRTDEEDEFLQDSGFVARFVTNPVAMALTLFALLAIVAARPAFGTITGGALSQVPGRRGRLVAAARRDAAPARHRHRRARAGLRPAVRPARARSSVAAPVR